MNDGERILSLYSPDLVAEWHPTKNKGLSPDKITVGSNKKVWWLCSKGHEWEAKVNNRVYGRGCPYCSGNKVLIGFNDLATVQPSLVLEWNYPKNNPLLPNKVTAHSNKRVWWICKNGHEWETSINHRSQGQNCPYCQNKKPFSGHNDLLSNNADLASEWHPTKNGTLRPEDVTTGSRKKVWWKCSNGHEWQATVYSRYSGTGCPICTKYLHTSFPEQAVFFYVKQKYPDAINGYTDIFFNKMELDIFIPSKRIGIEYDGKAWHSSPQSTAREKKKYAICREQGITLIRLRESNEKKLENCDICIFADGKDITSAIIELNQYGVDLLIDDINIDRDRLKIQELYKDMLLYNSLLARFPNVAAEWHPSKNGNLLPSMFSGNSNTKVWWQCSKGHEWQALINSRSRGSGCPICANQVVLVGYNDMATTAPDLAAEWHPIKNHDLKPENVMANSNKKVWWQCSKGHEWQAIISSRSKSGCPICGNKEVLVGYNDLATLNPMLAMEWHPTKNGTLLPNNVTTGSSKKIWWQCSKGHEWQASIYSRNTGHGCPYCAGQKVLVGINDLATTNPKLMAEWHPTKNGKLYPKDVCAGSDQKVWWQCAKGHEWQAVIQSRSRGRGCPICSGQKVLAGFNDLATINPMLAAEWHPTKNNDLHPENVTAQSQKIVWWQCSKGHEWRAIIGSRNRGRGCPICANNQIVAGINDLESLYPNLAKEWHPTKNGNLRPDNVSSGSTRTVWWQCSEGHEWKARIYHRTKTGTKCPYCSGRLPIVGKTDLATINPTLAAEWHPTKNGTLTPFDVCAQSNKKAWWKCSKGHEWEAIICNRSNGRGCPLCRKEAHNN